MIPTACENSTFISVLSKNSQKLIWGGRNENVAGVGKVARRNVSDSMDIQSDDYSPVAQLEGSVFQRGSQGLAHSS